MENLFEIKTRPHSWHLVQKYQMLGPGITFQTKTSAIVAHDSVCIICMAGLVGGLALVRSLVLVSEGWMKLAYYCLELSVN